MKLKNIVIVILRLFTLSCLLQAIMKAIPTLIRITVAQKEATLIEIITPWSMIIIYIILALIFWFLVSPIASLVTRKLPDDKLDIGSFSMIDCYCLIFIGIGLFYILGNMAQSLNWIHYIFKLSVSTSSTYWRTEVGWYSVSKSLIPFIIGILLIIKAKSWSQKLFNFHNKCNKTE